MDRRKFFAAGAVAFAGIAAACNNKTKHAVNGITNGSSGSPGANQPNVALTTNDLLENTTSRIGFVVRKGETPIEPKNIEIAIDKDPNGKFSHKITGQVHTDTQSGAPYVSFAYPFGATGTYFMRTKSNGATSTSAINVVHASAIPFPKPGDKMIPFDSPTTSNAQGVNPICTRVPVCGMHDETITQALAANKPLLVAFATPALCQTATCGPVVDVVLAVRGSFPNVHYLHEEIYTNETSGIPAPTPSAYKLQSEPVVYMANSNGTIVERFDGLFGEAELRAALAKLS